MTTTKNNVFIGLHKLENCYLVGGIKFDVCLQMCVWGR